MDKSLADELKHIVGKKGCIVSVIGPDGSGKSTLIDALHDAAREARIDTVRIHSYRWHRNIFAMPLRLSILRQRGKLVLLDRCVFDNVVELALKRSLSPPLRRGLSRFLSLVYVDFDARILLRAPADVIAERRPDEPLDKTRRQIALYEELLTSAGYRGVDSTEPTLPPALAEIRRGMRA